MIKTIVKINGMMCNMCEAHVNKAISSNFSVESVKADHEKGVCEIVSAQALDEAKLKAVIADTGYEFVSAAAEG